MVNLMRMLYVVMENTKYMNRILMMMIVIFFDVDAYKLKHQK